MRGKKSYEATQVTFVGKDTVRTVCRDDKETHLRCSVSEAGRCVRVDIDEVPDVDVEGMAVVVFDDQDRAVMAGVVDGWSGPEYEQDQGWRAYQVSDSLPIVNRVVGVIG